MQMQSDLSYFTHEVDGTTYGAWYRVLDGIFVEVLAVGLMHTVTLGGSRPEAVARTVLADFVRTRNRCGAPLPGAADLPK